MRHFLSTLLFFLFLFGCSTPESPIISLSGTYSRLKGGTGELLPVLKQYIDSVETAAPDSYHEAIRLFCDSLVSSNHRFEAAALAAWPHGIDLPGDKYSEIGERLLIQLLLPGHAAPALPFEYKKAAIVFFFESDCHSCTGLIDELTASYDSLQSEGTRIISIASDLEPDSYEIYTRELPWTDKYCDYQSFDGEYFQLWGVASTPTMFYVDGNGIVTGRYYSLQEITHEP